MPNSLTPLKPSFPEPTPCRGPAWPGHFNHFHQGGSPERARPLKIIRPVRTTADLSEVDENFAVVQSLFLNEFTIPYCNYSNKLFQYCNCFNETTTLIGMELGTNAASIITYHFSSASRVRDSGSLTVNRCFTGIIY